MTTPITISNFNLSATQPQGVFDPQPAKLFLVIYLGSLNKGTIWSLPGLRNPSSGLLTATSNCQSLADGAKVTSSAGTSVSPGPPAFRVMQSTTLLFSQRDITAHQALSLPHFKVLPECRLVPVKSCLPMAPTRNSAGSNNCTSNMRMSFLEQQKSPVDNLLATKNRFRIGFPACCRTNVGSIFNSQTFDSAFIASLRKPSKFAKPPGYHKPDPGTCVVPIMRHTDCQPTPLEFPPNDPIWDHWNLYNKVINGPGFAGGQDWQTLSILTCFNSSNCCFNKCFIFSNSVTPKLVEFTQDLNRELYAITSNTPILPITCRAKSPSRADVEKMKDMVNYIVPMKRPIFLWIGVFPNSLQFQPKDTLTQAKEPLSLLADSDIDDVEVKYYKSLYRQLASSLCLHSISNLNTSVNVCGPLTLVLHLTIAISSQPNIWGTMGLFFATQGHYYPS
ncbi:hypothetical protein BV22DRAFT_1051460 [Leucogyrophana mollusca]|uniref:Uncharacterized protein n=1 Tax=Leucogyrophana mollusca TaxID=85980 RepID=A0ACB8B000_9AGAM|nr:hypothetical protein BV22DRAFT_1051460 [Leucogyrophana mollusca]